MITLIGLYDFTHEEIGAMLHYSRTWVGMRAAEAMDSLSEIFLSAGILQEDRPDRRQSQVGDRSVPPDVVAIAKKKASASGPAQPRSPGPRYAAWRQRTGPGTVRGLRCRP
jgi:hypothetical protein